MIKPRLADAGFRKARATQGVSPKQKVTVTLPPPVERKIGLAQKAHVIECLADIEKMTVDPKAKRPACSASLAVGELQIFVRDLIGVAAERSRLQKELKRVKKEIAICQKKSANEKFVARAPDQIQRTKTGDRTSARQVEMS